ncbi:leucine-rich melanocyte differentiation-associated protein-like [Anopheles ziemanni]|uniref:leucine-rich melanocyte differentiation-associated protein-like n=1 Tax=Anopheles coustani TaxID=139045 RepID=UPI002659A4AC|nr:leucine-rich melanocyte differentiation-associated protein-like [Anopheles coustani]XP_058172289.1 leucine-rich melanocyte differentiation-associated protein-like [Anopheles ziemanni]
MQAIGYNERFFVDNYSTMDEDDELYMSYDWSSDAMSVKSAGSGSSRSDDYDQNGERLSLAYERLSQIPRKIAEKFSRTTTILDLSYNEIKDLSFLTHFRQLNTLILDKNLRPDERSLPSLPNLELLWLNHCDINNLQNWIYRIRECCPSLKYLSLMGNPGATSSFNGNSSLEHNDYRLFVISLLPQLRHLDDSEVTAAQRTQAKSFKHSYNLNQGPYNIFETTVGRRPQQQPQASPLAPTTLASLTQKSSTTATPTSTTSSPSKRSRKRRNGGKLSDNS